jgi:glycosyltransferase involved in cell wall biosynthesis
MPRAERIAFVTPRFSGQATIGGAETLIKHLALRAARDGRQVTLLTTCARDHFTWTNVVPPGRRTFDGLTVEYFPVDEDRDVDRFLRIQAEISRGATVTDEEEAAWMQHNVNSRALCDHLRAAGSDYDRIVLGPYLFGLIYHAALVHPEKSFLVPCLHDEPFAWLRLMQGLFDGVAGLLFNTEPERDLARRLYGLAPSRGAVVGMGLEPFEADPAAFARRHGLAQPYVVYAGRREPLKGTPLLLDYMRTFRDRTGRDLRLVFTGSGPLEADPELQPYILDVGFVDEREKREALAGALAFIHPSVNESLGIVLLEAWLARTPALVHADGAVLSWQCRRSGGGLWFRHYPDFEEELRLLLDQPGLGERLGAAGRAYVEREYAWPAVDARLFTALDA